MYKTDLARGYRQMRVDPRDWLLLGFQHRGQIYLDVCPPFGLCTSAMFMQRTSEAICYIHEMGRAERALGCLQKVMAELGVREALHKVCKPARQMIWLGIYFDADNMTMAIPAAKLREVMDIVRNWEGRTRATQRDMQKLLGLLHFVASVNGQEECRVSGLSRIRCMYDRLWGVRGQRVLC